MLQTEGLHEDKGSKRFKTQTVASSAKLLFLQFVLKAAPKFLPLTSCFLFPATEEGEYFLKVLIPSYAAGSIIGKGGQTIVQLQKETGATIKLSKSKDFYPGKPRPLLLIDGWMGLLPDHPSSQ